MMMRRSLDCLALACALTTFGCTQVIVEVDGLDEETSTESSSGDGDGDPASGDGDGDPTTTGDGDGDPTTTGDGDGDPTTTGDGDGDPTTTGDGDGDPPEPVSANVLLLGDGVYNDVVSDSLEAGGHVVTVFAESWNWNNNPTLDGIDVVVYIEAAVSGEGLKKMARDALDAFLDEGGAMVRTEWAAHDLSGSNIDVLLPVRAPNQEFAYGATWTAQAFHPIVASVPDQFAVGMSGCSIVEAEPEAVVLFTNDLCGPALTYQEVGDMGGRVLHINDDLGADNQQFPEPVILDLLNASVSWLAE